MTLTSDHVAAEITNAQDFLSEAIRAALNGNREWAAEAVRLALSLLKGTVLPALESPRQIAYQQTRGDADRHPTRGNFRDR
jgi:hypothetical protein